MRNDLQVEELYINLIPPFIMRKDGIAVDECPKYQAQAPSVSHHLMYSKEANLRTHFDLNGTFSSFKTRAPSNEELGSCDKVFITPDSASWNPYSEHFSRNEQAMIDCDGGLAIPTYKESPLITDQDEPYLIYPTVSSVDVDIDKVIDLAMENDVSVGQIPMNNRIGNLDQDLLENAITGKINARLGTMPLDPEVLNKDPLFIGTLDDLDDRFTSNVSSVTTDQPVGVSPSFLKKVWSISDKEANAVIKKNTQLNRQSNDGLLSIHFSTNDRMMRYKRIESDFYSDTMSVTKVAKSTRGNLHLQFFVSDKGFVAVYGMEKRPDFKDALHMFCKQVGVSIALVVDPSGEQTSKNVRRFCNQVGNTLRVLEESTQWANRVELYIGLFKQAIRKDLSGSDSPMVLWNYCTERRALIHNLTPRDLFQTDGQSPYQFQHGVRGYISNLCSFD